MGASSLKPGVGTPLSVWSGPVEHKIRGLALKRNFVTKSSRLLSSALLVSVGLFATAGCSGSTGQNLNANTPPAPPAAPAASTVSRVVGTVKDAVIPRPVTVKASANPFQVSLQAGWNLFSNPFSSITSFSLSQPSADLSCFSYNATTGAYVTQTFSQAALNAAPNPYQGYWVFCSQPVTLTINGNSSPVSPVQTSLVPGWNLLGTPLSANVAGTAFTFSSESLAAAAASSLIGSQGFNYSPTSGAYSSLSYAGGSFPAFQATWIFAFSAGTLSTPNGNGEPAGTITEFKTGLTAGSPYGICAGPDGNMWFAEYGSNPPTVGRITTSGTITEFTFGISQGNPTNICAGPPADGNLWFTESQGAKIAKISPLTGTVTEFSTAGVAPNSVPWQITAGSDGNLWFTDQDGADEGAGIGRITPAGVVTEFATPTTNSLPTGICLGSDGNIWFTEGANQANQVGRVTPAGVVTEFPSGFYTAPSGIAPGPDGALWFCCYSTAKGNGAIARITTAGNLTLFDETAVLQPTNIVAGSDGNMWFTEYSGPAIGSISPTTGQVSTYSAGISPGVYPYGIAAGPDGNIWFGEAFGGVGQIVP